MGTNGWGDAGKGELFSSTELSGFTTIDKAIYTIAKASGTSGNITFSVLNATGTSTLGSEVVPLSTVVSSYGGQAGASIIIDFDPDITIPAGQGIIVAASVPTGASGDTLALVSNTNGDVVTGSAYELYNGTWGAVSASWSINVSAAIFPIVCSGTVGNEETLGLNEVIVYPNPTRGEVNIAFGNSLKGNTIVKIYNNIGSLISENSYSETTNKISTISLNNVESGIYYVTILNNDQVITKRISIIK